MKAKSTIIFVFLFACASAQEEKSSYTMTYNESQFHAVGDFNGDNTEDTVSIIHHFENSDNQLITIKYSEQEELWRKYCELNPQIWISASKHFNPLVIDNSCKASGPQEISYLGDINNDGRSEFALLLWEFDKPAEKLFVYSYANNSWIAIHEFEYYVNGNPEYYPSMDDYFERDDDFVARWFINKDGERISLTDEK